MPTLVGGLRQANFCSSHRGCCSIRRVSSSYRIPSSYHRAQRGTIDAHIVFENMDNKDSIFVYPTNTNTWLSDPQWPKYTQHRIWSGPHCWTMTATVGKIGIHDDDLHDTVHISPSLWDQLRLKADNALLLQPKFGSSRSSIRSALVCNAVSSPSVCIQGSLRAFRYSYKPSRSRKFPFLVLGLRNTKT